MHSWIIIGALESFCLSDKRATFTYPPIAGFHAKEGSLFPGLWFGGNFCFDKPVPKIFRSPSLSITVPEDTSASSTNTRLPAVHQTCIRWRPFSTFLQTPEVPRNINQISRSFPSTFLEITWMSPWLQSKACLQLYKTSRPCCSWTSGSACF